VNAGGRLAGSYVNFYIGSRRVVVPLLDRKRDGDALRKLGAVSASRSRRCAGP
jgi:agmatine/peptidylarginine deiminase